MNTGDERGQKSNMTRASVSLSLEVYKTLEQIAQEKKVSVAWVIREAVDKYLADKWPLFARPGGE